MAAVWRRHVGRNINRVYIRILTSHNANAVRDEANPKTAWKNRRDRVKALLLKIDADIICLQELRILDITPETWLAEFTDYRFDIVYCNATKLGFARAILYKLDKLMPVDRTCIWLSDSPDSPSDFVDSQGKQGYGSVLQGIHFLRVHDGKVDPNSPIRVYNAHLGMDELVKTQSCALLAAFGDRTRPRILAGDFNFFADKDGRSQYETLAKNWDNLAIGRITSQSGLAIQGTFVGYEADAFKASQPVNFGVLDHIFTCGFEGSDARVHTETMLQVEPNELTERDSLPSDHLPLSVIVEEL